MIVPDGYISLKDAGRELQGDYCYPDDSMPGGYDFDDANWSDELWRLVEGFPLKGVTPLGVLLDIPDDDRRETPSKGWYGPKVDYTPFENEWLDLEDGRIKSGDFAGCMIVIPKAKWAAYLRERETGVSPALGGRPPHPAKEWYWERGCERGGKTIKELQRDMPRDEKGNPPSVSAIRSWENEYRQKPPIET